jgi:hypothetical protein
MPLVDYNSNNGNFHDETNLNFEKKTTGTHAVKPLLYYYSINGRWEQRELPIEILQMQIGTNPYECEIQLENPEADKVQVKIRRIGEVWYFIDSGKNDMMIVNGIKRRQAHLLPDSSIVIQIGGIIFIFSTKSDKLSLKQDFHLIPKSGAPEEGEFSLTTSDKELRYPFEKLCLIGANPLCDFYINGQQFCGFVSHFNKRLLFTPLNISHDIFITKDGLNVTENTPLTPGSKLRIDTSEITVRLSKELRFSKNFNFVPDPKEECMMLLQLDEKGNPGNAFALPFAGRSIFIGRDAAQSRIVIPDSNRISRQHAQAIVYDKSILLIDNDATNGTFVNNERIKKRLVHPGDIIRFGDCYFILCFVA